MRERLPDAVIAHFIHIPWVGPEGWSVLPDEIVAPIHRSLLCRDVVSFHTNRWRERVPVDVRGARASTSATRS